MSARPILPLALVLLTLTGIPMGCSSGGTAPSGASGTARAERICCASQLGGGDGATARAGDFLLSNGQLRTVVQELTPSRWLIETKGGAVTNPIWVDRDGNGRLDPPGMPNPRLGSPDLPPGPDSSKAAR